MVMADAGVDRKDCVAAGRIDNRSRGKVDSQILVGGVDDELRGKKGRGLGIAYLDLLFVLFFAHEKSFISG